MDKKIKKIFTICTLICLAIPIILLILAIFGVKVFEGIGLKVLLTFATLAVAGAFSINALNIYTKQKIVSLVSIGLLALSSIMAIIIYWLGFKTPTMYNNFTIVLAMATILFCIIVSMHLKLDKRFVPLQIITYICIILIDLFLTINIFFINLFNISGLPQTFAILCLVSFALLCTTAILGKKSNEVEESTSTKKFVKISIDEYEGLKSKIKELESEIKKLKK